MEARVGLYVVRGPVSELLPKGPAKLVQEGVGLSPGNLQRQAPPLVVGVPAQARPSAQILGVKH